MKKTIFLGLLAIFLLGIPAGAQEFTEYITPIVLRTDESTSIQTSLSESVQATQPQAEFDVVPIGDVVLLPKPIPCTLDDCWLFNNQEQVLADIDSMQSSLATCNQRRLDALITLQEMYEAAWLYEDKVSCEDLITTAALPGEPGENAQEFPIAYIDDIYKIKFNVLIEDIERFCNEPADVLDSFSAVIKFINTVKVCTGDTNAGLQELLDTEKAEAQAKLEGSQSSYDSLTDQLNDFKTYFPIAANSSAEICQDDSILRADVSHLLIPTEISSTLLAQLSASYWAGNLVVKDIGATGDKLVAACPAVTDGTELTSVVFFDEFGRVIATTTTVAEGTVTREETTYDEQGRVISMIETTLDTDSPDSIDYTYDELGRIVSTVTTTIDNITREETKEESTYNTYNALGRSISTDTDSDGIGDICDTCPADATNNCKQTSSAIIGPEGGTIIVSHPPVPEYPPDPVKGILDLTLDVPAGALDKYTNIFASSYDLPAEPIKTSFGLVTGPTYDLGPSGLQFQQPVAIDIGPSTLVHHPEWQVTEPEIFEFQPNEGTWIPQGAVFDLPTDMLSFQTTHFSRYAVGRKDITPPEISLSVSPADLWPANHQMAEIAVDLEVTDDYDPNPVVALEVLSSEPDDEQGNGDGNTINDIQIIDGKIFLRAERAGGGTGRTYTITYQATDISGNSASKSVTVFVPHDRGRR